MSKQKQLTRKQVEASLNWKVSRMPIQLEDGTKIESHFANTRVDDDGERKILGVVGKGYQVIQNTQLLDLADTIRKDHKLKFTRAGMLGNGDRIYFQCAGESFSVGKNDEVTPYMLFVNAHDGSLACRMAPMTERMVCENQLANFIKREAAFVSIRHAGDTSRKLEEASRVGAHFLTVCKANKMAMIRMRKKQVSKKKMADYFRDLYIEHIREIDINPKTRPDDLARNRADIAFQRYKKRFEEESPIAGTTAWNMANAYTGWLQHDHRIGKNPERSKQRRLHSSLFGILAQRSVHAFQVAMNV